MSLGELKKMKLVAYTDISFNTKADGLDYDVLINPESYALTYGTEVNQKSAQGSSESITSFSKRSAQSLTFKFLFDGTGVIKRGGGGLLSGLAVPGLPADKPDVVQDFEKFKSVVYDYDGTTHQPRYVQLQWGPLLYNCQMTRMTLTFKLFNPDGTPLRAEADCTFQGVIDETKLAAIENRQSPDLTHIRTVIKGDTLPLMCYKEYGDSKYYYQVAQYNGLTDFKKLTAGTKIIFPPIAK
ncbi:LysM peptidoglycan-binding domain-containing protein [Mucilaginibacter sp. HC2]|uniref:CIS tube protein n=1 Tax=Mucilaginibacter inviolabilis TaxID=2714892 RepID=UPI0014075EE6|nr:LysM peptidoglycan-binding domain-containing protein [Mucilaginibacter inviolabilis]NHA02969.1 LysM peptidoglycan-binding domain-containing protein [Mucilaginibacter inviolabilis]DAF70616.1 MAG TPA: secretion system protein [Caudoviricetes sp.]DAK73171.1 MAG TPA: secretion system protein [Bacteriophage sp.]